MKFELINSRPFKIVLINIIVYAFIGIMLFNSLGPFIVTLLSYIIIIPPYYLYFQYLNNNKITWAKFLYIISLILTPIVLLIPGMVLALWEPMAWLVLFFICAAGFVNGIINYSIINIATKNIKWYEIPIVFTIAFSLIFILYELFIH